MPARIKEKNVLDSIFKKLRQVLLALIFLAVLVVILVVALGKTSDKIRREDTSSPVATMEYLKPTKNHYNGSILKYTYRYGTLTIDRDYPGNRDLKPHRLFAEIYTSWPEFGKRDQYLKSDESKRLRIMFEIDKSGVAAPRDLYGQYSDNLNSYAVQDNRYPGFIGYKIKNAWIYIATNSDLIMPQGTPVVISCSDDDSFAYFSKRNIGHCSYHFIFDKNLRAIVRFDKPLMKDFVQVHKDLMGFISSVRESK